MSQPTKQNRIQGADQTPGQSGAMGNRPVENRQPGGSKNLDPKQHDQPAPRNSSRQEPQDFEGQE